MSDDSEETFTEKLSTLVKAFNINTKETLRDTFSLYRKMSMDIKRYFVLFIIPSILISIGLMVAAVVYLPILWLTVLSIILASLLPIAVLLYPKILQSRERKEINAKFNLFVTHLTVLSLTNTDRVEMFRRISDTDDYGALATEIGRLVGLVDTFNMSLADAARRRAKQTQSELLRDFYEQMAYNIGSGQTLPMFLITEQETVQSKYSTNYQAKLEKIETLSELFLSTVLTTTFLFVFGVIVPFLTGIDPLMILGGVIFIYITVQLIFIVLINATTPSDKFWFFTDDIQFSKGIKMKLSLAIGVVSSTAIAGLFFTFLPSGIPIHFYPVISVLPLIIPSIYIYRIEKDIHRVERQYSEFIRSLGSVEAVKRTSTRNVISTLKDKNFGRLTKYIQSMHNRMSLSINNYLTWQLFSAEIGSNLIKRFSDMYVLGREMGGEPDTLGEVISENFRTMMNLRKERQTKSANVTGMMYGITVASSMTFFVVIEIIKMLVDVSEDIDAGGATEGLLNPAVYNIDQLVLLIFIAIIINSFLVSILVRIIKRRYIGGAVIHFMVLITASFTIGYLIETSVGNFF